MSENRSSASPRPTLPGIQQLLPDDKFYNLSALPTGHLQNVANASYATLRPVESGSSERRTHHVGHEIRPMPLSGPTASSAAPRSSRQSPGGVPPMGRRNRSFDLSATRLSPTAQMQYAQSAGPAFHDPPAGRHILFPLPSAPSGTQTRSSSALQNMRDVGLPTYIVPAEECSPDDDRRHGCGICHRRFNRPSSLRIHMNSHTGEQPFECPFPGCSRRFSVNSNMRRHYRNHREGHSFPPPSSYGPLYRNGEQPHMLYRMLSSPASTLSSFSDAEERPETPAIAAGHGSPYEPPQMRMRSVSEVYPPREYRAGGRPRSCTVPGCDCDEAPMVLRPAFQQGSTSRPAREPYERRGD